MAETTQSAVILNVDDDEAGRYAVTRMLRRAGYSVLEAGTGRQALSLAASMPIDLVVLDVNLPDISGLEVARRLRSDLATGAIPILHLSASALDQASVATGLESGADAYLCEPVSEGVLLAQIGTLLRMRRLHQEVTQAREQAEQHAQQLALTLEELQAANEELEVMNEELRTAQEETEQHETLLQGVINGVPGVVFVKDREGRFLTINRRMEELLGRPRESVAGKTDYDLFPADVAEDYGRYDRRVLATGQPYQFEQALELADGRHVFLVNEFPLRTTDGTAYAVCGISTDITERKRMEEALLAVERARAELAESLNREIAHRTKNNLAMVAGLLQLQMTQQHEPGAADAISDAISRVITFASIQQELQRGAVERADLLVILGRVAAASGDALAAQGLTTSVTGDAVLLPPKSVTNLAVIANELITNAAKYGAPGPEGKLRVEVAVERTGQSLRLRVWNSGNPVAVDLDLATQRGMGVLLVRELAGQYGGTFTLRPDRAGSLAEVILPLRSLEQQ